MKFFFRQPVLLVMVCIFPLSCTQNQKLNESEAIVNEWVGKIILFPAKVSCSFVLKDTVCPNLAATTYKILLYTDSTGCTSCKLKSPYWKDFIQEVEDFEQGKISFLFYFHPQEKKQLKHLLKHEGFSYPVFIDERNQIDSLNHFPKQQEYQCFLLNKENKVVAMGNPTMNPKIWELYKNIIWGDTTATIQGKP
ncbi:hypothetical protein [Viscerimonas tarda]